jgi:hypothetical protein
MGQRQREYFKQEKQTDAEEIYKEGENPQQNREII